MMARRGLAILITVASGGCVGYAVGTMALEVFGISSALFALILIVAGKEEGYILGFAVCALLILYLTLYALYSRGEIS